jgi:MSHA biogenesis protein MshP
MMKYKIQQGFSLITAIFVLVVLASLGAMMTTFFAAQQQSSALDAIGGRAYQAARAGIEWGAFQITQSGIAGATFATLCQPGPTGSQVVLSGALSDFGVDVQCSAASAVEGGNAVWVYDITATASGVHGAVPGNADYAERQIQASVWTQDAIASQVIMWK